MEKSIYYAAGFGVGILAVAIVCIVLAMIARKKHMAPKYDERQELARGKAYRAAFGTLMAYLIVIGLLDTAFELHFGDTMSTAITGICLAVIVFACSCIAHDAYFSVHDKPKAMVLLFVVLTVINLGIGIFNLCQYGFLQDGMLTIHSANMICGIMSLIILGAILLKLWRDRNIAEE